MRLDPFLKGVSSTLINPLITLCVIKSVVNIIFVLDLKNMKKRFILLIAIVSITMSSYAQVKTGINTTDPKATLDIVASNTATPANTDGLLIPRLDVVPATTQQ